MFGWTREEFIEEGEKIIENVETDRDDCYVEPALLGRNLNRWKFPLVMVNESEQPYKLVAYVLIGRLMTGGKDFVKRYERDVLHGSEFKNKRGRKPDTGGRKRREKGGKPGSKRRHCNLGNFSKPRKGKVKKLIEEFEVIFSKGENDLGRTTLVTHDPINPWT